MERGVGEDGRRIDVLAADAALKSRCRRRRRRCLEVGRWSRGDDDDAGAGAGTSGAGSGGLSSVLVTFGTMATLALITAVRRFIRRVGGRADGRTTDASSGTGTGFCLPAVGGAVAAVGGVLLGILHGVQDGLVLGREGHAAKIKIQNNNPHNLNRDNNDNDNTENDSVRILRQTESAANFWVGNQRVCMKCENYS